VTRMVTLLTEVPCIVRCAKPLLHEFSAILAYLFVF